MPEIGGKLMDQNGDIVQLATEVELFDATHGKLYLDDFIIGSVILGELYDLSLADGREATIKFTRKTPSEIDPSIALFEVVGELSAQ
jgi:hypothetical protein